MPFLGGFYNTSIILADLRILEEILLVVLAVFVQLARVTPVKAGGAEMHVRLVQRREEGFHGQVLDRVDAEVLAYLLDAVRRCDELLAGGDVDAVEAGKQRGRRRYPHVDLGCAGVAEHLDDLPHGGAPHDGIVHHDDPLSRYRLLHHVVLDLRPEVPYLLRRLDEGAADVVAPDEAQLVGDAGLA